MINDSGPAFYFNGPEMFIADGRTTTSVIASVWPQLPPSYRKFGVKGAAWAGGKVVLFRGGTYLTVPWTDGAPAPAATTPTPAAATPTAGVPTETPTARTPAAAEAAPIYHDALQAATTPSPTAAPARTPTPAASAAATHTPTPLPKPTESPTPAVSPTAATRTPEATPSAIVTASSTPAATSTATPGVTETPTATVTPTSLASPSPTTEPSVTPTVTPTPVALGAVLTDYVAAPLADITGWPQTGSWALGVIDGVYSQGNNVVLVVSGSEFMTLTFTDGAAPTASGPTQLSAHSSFAQLPSDWLTNGFDAGFYCVGGVVAGTAYVFNGAQVVQYSVSAGAEERAVPAAVVASPTATATPGPSAEVVATASPSASATTTPTTHASDGTNTGHTPRRGAGLSRRAPGSRNSHARHAESDADHRQHADDG
jgi:hypothetical protein